MSSQARRTRFIGLSQFCKPPPVHSSEASVLHRRRRFVMKNSMMATKVRTMIGAAAIVIGAASPARAEQRLVANVPFDFIVGTLRMPAGHYVVTESDDRAVVSIA